MSGISLRAFRPGDETAFPEIVTEAFGGIEYSSGLKKLASSEGFDPGGFFFAEESGSVKGCIGVFNLYRPNWLEIAYLSVTDPSVRKEVAKKLATRAIQYAESRNPEFLQVSTLAVQPYVDVYRSLGFKPVRESCAWLGICHLVVKVRLHLLKLKRFPRISKKRPLTYS